MSWFKNAVEWLTTPVWETFPNMFGGSTSSGSNTLNSSLNTAQDYLREERAYNTAEAQKSRDWQEVMSNTAYQRAVADLKGAGLNPYLAIDNGGAQVTSGATAQHSGFASSLISSLISNVNTIMNNQTSRDIAQMNNQTKILGKILDRF